MKKIISLFLVLIGLFCCVFGANADPVEIPTRDQGIVNDILYAYFKKDMRNLFKSPEMPVLAVGLAAAQMEDYLDNFYFNFRNIKEPIAYICSAQSDNKILFLALMDADGEFLMVSLIPSKDYMSFEDTLVSRKTAVSFIESYSDTSHRAAIYYNQISTINDLVESLTDDEGGIPLL